MLSAQRTRFALLTALALALSLGLVACSDDSLTSPADRAPQASLDEQWQAEVDALRAEIGDEAMAELAPQLEQARAELGDTAAKHGARLYLAYVTTTFDDLGIYGNGRSNVLGQFTTVGQSTVDFSTDPPTQYVDTVITDTDGEEIYTEGVGQVVANADFTGAEITGTVEFVGGTGPYANVAGTTWYFGNVDFVAATGWYLAWGWINLNG